MVTPRLPRPRSRAPAHKVSLDIDNQRLAPSPIEPRTVLAAFDTASGKLTVRIASQMPTAVRDGLAGLIPGLDTKKVRVVVGDVGGGFGMKTGLYPEDIAVGYASVRLKRPVKWVAERLEEFLSAVHGRDSVSRAELALDGNGKVLALRVRTFANVGAYATGAGIAIPLLVGPWVSTSIYDIPVIDLHFKAVLTNRGSTGPYRGAGRPEAIYIVERLMDAAAREMRVDPAELRRRNMIRPEQMPYKNPMDQVYDTGDFASILAQGLDARRLERFPRRGGKNRSGAESFRGRGIATFLEWTGGNALKEIVEVAVAGRRFHRGCLGDAADGGRASRPRMFSSSWTSSSGMFPWTAVRIIPGRYRPRQRLRQRRFALALHRRGRGERGSRQGIRSREGARRGIAGGLRRRDLEYRAGRFAVAGTGPWHRPLRGRRQPGSRAASTSSRRPRRTRSSWLNACFTSARSRSIRKRARSRSRRIPR